MISQAAEDHTVTRFWTYAELRGAGYSKKKVRKLKESGQLFRLFRGMYSNRPDLPEVLAFALVKSRNDIVFEGKTAIEIYTGRPLTFPLYARVKDRSFRTGLRGKVVLRRTRNLHRVVHEGLPVVSVIDLITSVLEWGRAGAKKKGQPSVIDSLKTRFPELFQPSDPSTFVDRPESIVPAGLIELFEKFYNGRLGLECLERDFKMLRPRQLRLAVPFTRCVAVAGAESSLEIKCVLALRKAGFSPTTQVSAGEYRWDMGLLELGVLIDVDGERYHFENAAAFYLDRWKTTDAQLEGWIAMRICGACFDSHFDQVIARLRQISGTAAKKRRKRGPAEEPSALAKVEPAWKWHSRVSRLHPFHDPTAAMRAG